MSEYLALDWDDQQLLGLDAQVASESLHVRKCVRFEWKADARPSEHTEAAGKQLRAELDRAGIGATHVLVSLPREEAIVRLLELPECTDDELPELVRLQAATRSAVPLDRLLLDFLPLPRIVGVAGRRVLMVTLGKPAADRIQAVLTAAGLQATAIHLSAIGAAEVVAHQPRAVAEDSDLAALIVSRSASRVEITAIARNQILFMHGATVSAHLPPEAIIAQILAETSRATVALSQAAPGSRIASGWIFGSTTELAGLPEAFRQRLDLISTCSRRRSPRRASAPISIPKVRRRKEPFPPWACCSRTRARAWRRSIFCIRGKKLSNPIAAACGRCWQAPAPW